MIYLLLSILASTAIFIVFKLFSRYKINTFHAIVANYVTACICGLISYESSINAFEIYNSKWFLGAILLGFLFISVFNLMALTAQRNGLSAASVASKMSVVIPVIFGIYIYNESIGFQKVLGIVLALIAVYLTAIKLNRLLTLGKDYFSPLYSL